MNDNVFGNTARHSLYKSFALIFYLFPFLQDNLNSCIYYTYIRRTFSRQLLPGTSNSLTTMNKFCNFSIGLMCLRTSGYYTQSKFLPGTVEKNSSTIRSSGRNRTYAGPPAGIEPSHRRRFDSCRRTL